MSHEKNFVSELVQMARAFEELPIVQADLMSAKNDIAAKAEAIQRLELRLIDAKNELDAAHAATRKAEVERDHAETMFLEADDAKMAAVRAMRHIIDEANGLIEIVQPAPKPEPVTEPAAQPKAEAHEVTVESQEPKAIDSPLYQDPQMDIGQPVPISSEPQVTSTDTVLNTTSPGEAGSSGNIADPFSGQREKGEPSEPTTALPDPIGTGTASEASSSEGVSVSLDPIISGAETTQSGPTSDVSDQTVQPDTAAAIVTSEPPQDDVGFHNEPKGGEAWFSWVERMNTRYGMNNWPSRYAV